MDLDSPRFQISEFIAPDLFTGRNCGTSLHVGQRFKSFRVIRYTGNIMDLHVDKEEIFGPIELTLVQTVAYGKVLDEFDSGLTGTIQVVGSDIPQIALRLKDLKDREYLSFESP